MGICILSLAHESEKRVYLVYVLIVKYLSHQFCLNSAIVYIRLDGPIEDLGRGGIFKNIFRGVCGPCHLLGLYGESALFIYSSLAFSMLT